MTDVDSSAPLLEHENIFKISDKNSTPETSAPLTDVPEKVFAKMKTDQGPTISEFCSKGLKVVLFFMRSLACPYCAGTLEDIYALYDTLYKLNTIVVVLYQEKPNTFKEYIKENPKFSILYSLPQAAYKKQFKITYGTWMEQLWPSTLVDIFRKDFLLRSSGVKPSGASITEVDMQDHLQLAAIFVVHKNKVISEVRKNIGSDRFDLARIVIDPDNFGIQVHTSIFACERPQKPKIDETQRVIIPMGYNKTEIKKEQNSSGSWSSWFGIGNSNSDSEGMTSPTLTPREKSPSIRKTLTLIEVLESDRWRSYFKLHMAKEFNVENLLFWEEVENYKKLTLEDRPQRAKLMVEKFFRLDAEYEINTTQKAIKSINDDVNTGRLDLFEEVIYDVRMNGLIPSFRRFLESDLLVEMQKPNKNKQTSLFVDY